MEIATNEYIPEKCAICLEYLIDDFECIIQCGHVFHTSCLRQALEQRQKCPKCRCYVQKDAAKNNTVLIKGYSIKTQSKVKQELEVLLAKLSKDDTNKLKEIMKDYEKLTYEKQNIKEILEEKQKQVKEFRQELDKIKKQNESYTNKIQSLQGNLEIKKNLYEEEKQKNQQFSLIYEQQKQKNQQLQNEIDELLQYKEEKQILDQLHLGQEDNQILQNIKNEHQNNYQRIANMFEKLLIQQNKQIQQQNIEQQQQNQEMQNKQDELNNEIKNKEEQIKTLIQNQKKAQEIYFSNKKKHEQLEMKYKELQKQKSQQLKQNNQNNIISPIKSPGDKDLKITQFPTSQNSSSFTLQQQQNLLKINEQTLINKYNINQQSSLQQQQKKLNNNNTNSNSQSFFSNQNSGFSNSNSQTFINKTKPLNSSPINGINNLLNTTTFGKRVFQK